MVTGSGIVDGKGVLRRRVLPYHLAVPSAKGPIGQVSAVVIPKMSVGIMEYDGRRSMTRSREKQL